MSEVKKAGLDLGQEQIAERLGLHASFSVNDLQERVARSGFYKDNPVISENFTWAIEMARELLSGNSGITSALSRRNTAPVTSEQFDKLVSRIRSMSGATQQLCADAEEMLGYLCFRMFRAPQT